MVGVGDEVDGGFGSYGRFWLSEVFMFDLGSVVWLLEVCCFLFDFVFGVMSWCVVL